MKMLMMLYNIMFRHIAVLCFVSIKMDKIVSFLVGDNIKITYNILKLAGNIHKSYISFRTILK